MQCLFKAVRVINMNHAQERWKTVTKHLSDLHIAHERMLAIDGSKLSPIVIRKVTWLSGRLFCSKAMIGCFMSHRKAWRHGAALILEDDVRMVPNAAYLVAQAFEQLPVADWDVFVIGSFTSGQHEIAWPEKLLAMFLRTNATCTPYSSMLVCPSMLIGLHAYAVSERGARKLTACIPKMSEHVDWSISRLITTKKLNVYAMQNVAFQDGHATSQICCNVPFVLNLMAHTFSLGDGRTVAWLLSEPLFVFLHDSLAFNYWCLLFMVIGMLLEIPIMYWIVFLALDFVALRLYTTQSCLCYIMPLGFFVFGQVMVHHVLF
jgi:GR25 family glycosyltransferase involved in LPS biosynthesis